MKKRRRGRGEGAVFFSQSKQAWVARLPLGRLPSGKTKYRELTARSKAEVLARLREADQERRGGLGEASKVTLAAYLAHWLASVVLPAAQPTTYDSYEMHVRVHVVPWLGHVALGSLSRHDVEGLYGRLSASSSPAVARKVGQTLGTALRHAVRLGLIARAPTDLVRRPRAARVEVEPFTPAEVKAILAEAEGRRHHALFALALATGMRLGELLGLGWQHIDLSAGTVRVERALSQLNSGERRMKGPKSASGRRTVSLPPFAVEALRTLREKAQEAGMMALPVFHTPAGRPLTRSSVRRCWRRLLKAAGVPYRRFHATRTTHASQLLAMGVSLVEVARRLGDKPDTILKAYAAYMPADNQAVGKLEKLYGGESTPSPPSRVVTGDSG